MPCIFLEYLVRRHLRNLLHIGQLRHRDAGAEVPDGDDIGLVLLRQTDDNALTGAAVLGLGYIVGLKYAFIICCGSFLVWLVIIPLMNLIWGGDVIDLMNIGITTPISQMSPDQIFKEYARHIGIGQPR